ncbi:hypothetical protein Tco_1052641 [Tanacetum coccineum]
MIRIYNETHFQNYEWYGLEDGDLKEETLKEKAIIEGSWGHKHTKVTMNDDTIRTSQKCLGKQEPIKDDDSGYLGDYLVHDDAPFVINEEDELYKERRCKLLEIPYERPLMCNSEKFELIKYSLGPEEEYMAIKENKYNVWIKTEENMSLVYQDLFDKKNEGWTMTRTK